MNPHAGADRALEFVPLINTRLRTLVRELDITIPVDADDAERASARAADEGCDALYVAGGDGTLNAALRGLASRGAIGNMPIGVIPLGTGNDFAKALGLGESPEPALDALLEARVVHVDLGTLNDRPFANTSAGGFIAEVSESVTEKLKNTAGKLAYLVGGARALVGTEPFSARLVVHPGEGPALDSQLDVQLFAVCNARFIGGGYPIAPSAMIDDGLLDVLVVPRMPMLQFVSVLQRVSAGQHAEDPSVLHFRSGAFDLEFDRAVRVNTDGEVLEAVRCHYRVRPRAARFFCGSQPQIHQRPRR